MALQATRQTEAKKERYKPNVTACTSHEISTHDFTATRRDARF